MLRKEMLSTISLFWINGKRETYHIKNDSTFSEVRTLLGKSVPSDVAIKVFDFSSPQLAKIDEIKNTVPIHKLAHCNLCAIKEDKPVIFDVHNQMFIDCFNFEGLFCFPRDFKLYPWHVGISRSTKQVVLISETPPQIHLGSAYLENLDQLKTKDLFTQIYGTSKT